MAKSKGRQVRVNRVNNAAASQDKRLRLASGVNQVLGVGVGLVNPLAGIAVYGAGMAVAEKARADNRKAAATKVASIERGASKPRSATPTLSAAYRAGSSSGSQLASSEADRFKSANAEFSGKQASQSQGNPTDGMTDAHVRVNKKTGNAAPVQAFKTPERRGGKFGPR